ncbi:hypothetical protein SUGI_0298330 [Cryptomeria japonica]|nr:hypothetical protein SUGI_0298330 [Cryptomeria japonica]
MGDQMDKVEKGIDGGINEGGNVEHMAYKDTNPRIIVEEYSVVVEDWNSEEDPNIETMGILEPRFFSQSTGRLPWTIMKIVTWNVRGISSPDKRHLIKYNLEVIMVDLCLLQETKLQKEACQGFQNYFSKRNIIHVEVNGAIGGLEILWNKERVDVDMVELSRN